MRGGEKLKLGGKEGGWRKIEGGGQNQNPKVHHDTYNEVGRKLISILFPFGMIFS